MGKSSKKSASKVAAAPAVATPATTKPLKQGKRELENTIEKEVVSAKKQKVENKKTEIKPEKKKVEPSSEEDTSSSESELEDTVKKEVAGAKKQKVENKKTEIKPEKKKVEPSSEEDTSSSESELEIPKAAAVKRTAAEAKPEKKNESDDDSSDESDDDDTSEESDDEPQNKKMKGKKNESSDDDSSEESDDEEPQNKKIKHFLHAQPSETPKSSSQAPKGYSEEESSDEDEPVKTQVGMKLSTTVPKKESSSEGSSEESEEEEDEPPKAPKKNAKNESSDDDSSEESSDEDEPTEQSAKKLSATVQKKESSSEESSEESEEEEDEQPKTPKKHDIDVEMTDATATKTDAGKGRDKIPKTPVTPKEQSTASKTLFVGNLSFSVERADVENFLKPAGEVVDVRLAFGSDESFKGFGHVDFATAEAADKAVKELNGKELLGRVVKLDRAREKGEYTPTSGRGDSQSFQKGVRTQGQTLFVRGFDKSDGEDQIRSSLEQHFGSCGAITRISIPKDQDGGSKGIAYIDFKDGSAFNQALELNGTECGGGTLMVEEAKPRRDSFSGGDRGRRSNGRSGNRDFGSRSRGRGDSRGRFGNSRGDSGGRFGNSRGRGKGFSKPNLAAPGTGKKTTFNNDD
ncbi:hypothetical protein OROGR_010442 [Orobanche gracilis]